MSEPIIGIDLGTTNSEVAIVENGRVTVISENDEVVLPSVVGLADDGAILVGTSAQNQFALYPERTVKSVKRLMGNDEQIQLGDNGYSPQEISAIILKTLKARAEKHLGSTVSKAVITVPAYFSDSQRRATREAGEIAGLEVVRMINEPTAAALAYEAGKNTDKTVLIYDLGGGTFDVSVVSVQKGVVEVLASHGNNHLGGDDFDSKIVGFIEQHLTEQGANIDGDVKARARIRRAAEQAKIVLSDKPYTQINEEFITHVNDQPLHLDIEITRADYEGMIEDYIDETFDAIQTALEGAGLTPDSIDEIVLVGGSSRTPVIGRRLKAIFKQQPHGEINPDLCVATGAAIQAATIAGESFSAVLVDITPYTFGTSVLGERQGEPYPFVYVPVIEKNSSLPLSKSDIFYTSFDGQASVEVNIYQGEDPDAINNIAIGQFTVEGLSDVEAGNPIVLSLNLDLNGILKVTALEKETGLQKSITIDNAISSFNEAEIEGAKTRIDALINNNEIAPVESGEQEERPLVREDRGYQYNVQAQALVEKAERLLDDANGDDKEDLVDHIEAVKDALTAASSKALDSAVEGLTDLVYYLEV